MCPEDQYIASAKIKYEDWLGVGRSPGNDDTAAVGLRFKCKTLDESEESIQTVEASSYGNWKSWTHYAAGKFVSQARARVDESTLGDQSGLNGLEFWNCPIEGASS